MTDCKPLAKHWSVVTGCGRDLSVQLRSVRPMPCKEMKSKLVEDSTAASPLESRLHSNAQVRKRLRSWLTGYSWSGVLDQEEQQEE